MEVVVFVPDMRVRQPIVRKSGEHGGGHHLSRLRKSGRSTG